MFGERPSTVVADVNKPPSIRPAASSRLAGFDRWWLLLLAVIAIVILLIVAVPDPYAQIFVFLEDGIVVTLQLTIVSFFFILLVGMLGGLGRVSSNRVVSGIASLYVEVVRGIPVLVWLLWIWFALPQLLVSLGNALTGIAPAIGQIVLNARLAPYTAAIIGFTFAYGAYMTEVFRAGIQSIPKGQMEAARSLGMSYLQAMRYVVLPQAVRVILPPVGNEFVTLLRTRRWCPSWPSQT